jgi:hypothetical protein
LDELFMKKLDAKLMWGYDVIPHPFFRAVSIHRDSVSDNSTAIMSVAPTRRVAKERDAIDDGEKTRIEAVQAVMD